MASRPDRSPGTTEAASRGNSGAIKSLVLRGFTKTLWQDAKRAPESSQHLEVGQPLVGRLGTENAEGREVSSLAYRTLIRLSEPLGG